MPYAYIVRGSEDGNIGVFGSRKRAVTRAVQYVQQGSEDEIVVSVEHLNEWITYVNSEGTSSSADVERFDLE